MNRKNFGKLLRALRKEHRDEQGNIWTQKLLAKKAKMSKRTIENIENGNLAKLDSELLLRLAEALHLTSGERKQFFLAASGIEYHQIARQDISSEETLVKLIERANEVYLPAYIMDSYCDIIAVNNAVIKLLELEKAGITQSVMAQKPFGFNMLQFVFSPEAAKYHRKLMGLYWDNYAYQNMMLFRTLSFQHRSSSYFNALLNALLQYPYFKRYWQEIYWQEKRHIFNTEYIRLNSLTWGKLVYFSTSYETLTTSGELYLCVYVPATQITAAVFSEITQESGARMFQVSQWPQKKFHV